MTGSNGGRPTVLVLLGCFSPGVEATGPNQSLVGMARALEGRFRFRVIGQALPGDKVGEWSSIGGVEQLPLFFGRMSARGLRQAINETPHDLLITNGFFDRRMTIPTLLMRRAGALPRRPHLLAPHGEFSPGALMLGRARKQAYIAFAKAARLLDGVALQAWAPQEADDIRAAVPFFDGPVFMTPTIRPLGDLPDHQSRAEGAPLRVAFLSRIDRKKNLNYALERLAEAAVPLRFTIFGPVSDSEYWAECQALIAKMPPHVVVDYRGEITQAQVPDALAAQDLFFLPTFGENYGHAIVDALAAGTPVLLSDQTPWDGLESAGAGWGLPLAQPEAFVDAIKAAASLGPEAQRSARASTRRYAETTIDNRSATRALSDCLDTLIGRGVSAA